MKFVALEKVVDIKGGGTPDKSVSSYWNGDIPWASVKDFKSLEINKTIDTITQKGVANSATNIIPAGTVIVPTRMAVGKAAINKMDLAINQDLKALIPSSEVHNRYLLYFMLANSDELERQATGATVKGIKLDSLRNLKFPLLRFEDQKRIATILDRADELRRARRKSINHLNNLSQAIFSEMFGKNKVNPMVTLDEVSQSIDYGLTASGDKNCIGPKFLRITDIQEGKVDWSKVPYCKATEKQISENKLQYGDIVFARTGATTGKSFLIRDCPDQAVFASYLIRVKPSPKVLPEYLAAFFRTPDYWSQILQKSHGATLPGVNSSKLKQLLLPLPSKELQEEFSKKILKIERQIKFFEKNLLALEKLFVSLQYHAFSGEL